MNKKDLKLRQERLLELLDACLEDMPDNMVEESYQARNASNYLQAIYTIERMMKEEDKHGRKDI